MKPRQRKSWEQTALILAETIAQCRSQDPYVQVGACAVLQDNSVSLGYNGPPPGIEIDWSERESRGARVIHAEVNALRSVAPGQCKFLAVTTMEPSQIGYIAGVRLLRAKGSTSDGEVPNVFGS